VALRTIVCAGICRWRMIDLREAMVDEVAQRD